MSRSAPTAPLHAQRVAFATALLGLGLCGVWSGCSRADGQGGSFEIPPQGQGSTASVSSSSTGAKGPNPLPGATHSDAAGSSSSDVNAEGQPSSGASPTPARCDDQIRNGDESDVDCGGSSCPACLAQRVCNLARDCVSQVCSGGRCMEASCNDGVQNANETDIDCGGPSCGPCGGGALCRSPRDCRSGECLQGRCAPEACNQDADCAHLALPCQAGHCDRSQFRCVRVPANEGSVCDSGRSCVDAEVCVQGQCRGGKPRDCSKLKSACTLAFCNESTDRCESQSLIRWRESFQGITANNARGWRSSDNSVWRISPAKASVGCFHGQDPALDHSPDNSNMLLGTMVGSCLRGRIENFDCVYSPKIDLRNAPGDMELRFWRHLQSQESTVMQHQIMAQRHDGTWATLASGFSSAVWDNAWTPMSFSVKDFRHKAFSVAICLAHTDNASIRLPVAGWSLDDFSLAPKTCSQGL